MNVVITGAAGFLGRILRARLPEDWNGTLTLVDVAADVDGSAADAAWLTGAMADRTRLAAALRAADVVIGLAAVPGGAAERDYLASKSVNLDLPLAILDILAERATPARYVHASTIAVFGAPLPPSVDDATLPRPAMTYGAHKLMVETALANFARLGRVDGIAVRLPALLARPAGDNTMRSAFMSDLFHACAAGRPFIVPTSESATVWAMSASCGADNLLHAARIAPPDAATSRAFTLPALRVTMGELAGAVVRRTRCDPALVTFERDDELEAQFGRLPPLATPLANGLGFAHDGSLDRMVGRALADAGYRGD
jgi:nucleoside-diphosphate-sugar epimerase